VEVQDLHWERLRVHRGRIEASGVVVLDVLSVIRARACCRIDISVPALRHTALPILGMLLLARLDIGQLLGTQSFTMNGAMSRYICCLLDAFSKTALSSRHSDSAL
jgi:hypothetical protein